MIILICKLRNLSLHSVLSYHVHMRYLNLLMGLVNRCIVGFKFKSGYCLRQCIMDVWITHQLHFVSSSFNPVSPSVKHKIKIKETGRFHFAKINTEKEPNRTMWKYCKRGFLWMVTPKHFLHRPKVRVVYKTSRTMWKYCERSFIWMVSLKDFLHRLKS